MLSISQQPQQSSLSQLKELPPAKFTDSQQQIEDAVDSIVESDDIQALSAKYKTAIDAATDEEDLIHRIEQMFEGDSADKLNKAIEAGISASLLNGYVND